MSTMHDVVEGRDELLTVDEVAKLVKRPRRWVYEAVRTRKLPTPVRVGNQFRFPRSEIVAWLEEARS